MSGTVGDEEGVAAGAGWEGGGGGVAVGAGGVGGGLSGFAGFSVAVGLKEFKLQP